MRRRRGLSGAEPTCAGGNSLQTAPKRVSSVARARGLRAGRPFGYNAAMKAVILAGGLGTRISEETLLKPKPMVEIGGKPILWHIMKIYSAPRHQRFRDLLRLQGLRDQGVLRQLLPAHVGRHLRHAAATRWRCISSSAEPWRVTLVDTGEDTMTGGRLQAGRAATCATRRLSASPMATAWPMSTSRRSIALPPRARQARDRHRGPAARPLRRARASTATACTSFKEKPHGDGGWINGGFFVLSPKVLDYIEGDDDDLGARAAGAPRRATASCPPTSTRLLAADGHAARQEPARGAVGGRQGALEGVGMNAGVLARQAGLLTGHTGFKGSWLRFGCRRWARRCTGFALPPPTTPSLFDGRAASAAA